MIASLISDWGWREGAELPVAAYIHVPFCAHRCGYCNFSLIAHREDLIDRYLAALETELSALGQPRPVTTLFIGGGTPSLLSLPQTERLLTQLGRWLPLRPRASTGTEWSIEANPNHIDEDRLRLWRDLGIRRVSLGGQSFAPVKLKTLDRDHSGRELKRAIELSHQWMDSVSLDLIFGAPGETLNGWRDDLDQAIACEVDHLSTYGLTYEKGAAFWGLRAQQQIVPVSEETELAMYLHTIDRLTDVGYAHYEISNFAKPGHACRHNQAYWEGSPWWAFGPGAARYVAGVRSVNHRSTTAYMKRLEAAQSPVAERDALSLEQQARERFVFGMRQLVGVDLETFSKTCSPSLYQQIQQVVHRHIDEGWLEPTENRVRLTRRGLVVSDSLWPEYL